MISLYTIQEAAELLGIPYKTLWYAAITGKVKESRKIGRIRLFDDYDISEMKQFFEKARKE